MSRTHQKYFFLNNTAQHSSTRRTTRTLRPPSGTRTPSKPPSSSSSSSSSNRRPGTRGCPGSTTLRTTSRREEEDEEEESRSAATVTGKGKGKGKRTTRLRRPWADSDSEVLTFISSFFKSFLLPTFVNAREIKRETTGKKMPSIRTLNSGENANNLCTFYFYCTSALSACMNGTYREKEDLSGNRPAGITTKIAKVSAPASAPASASASASSQHSFGLDLTVGRGLKRRQFGQVEKKNKDEQPHLDQSASSGNLPPFLLFVQGIFYS